MFPPALGISSGHWFVRQEVHEDKHKEDRCIKLKDELLQILENVGAEVIKEIFARRAEEFSADMFLEHEGADRVLNHRSILEVALEQSRVDLPEETLSFLLNQYVMLAKDTGINLLHIFARNKLSTNMQLLMKKTVQENPEWLQGQNIRGLTPVEMSIHSFPITQDDSAISFMVQECFKKSALSEKERGELLARINELTQSEAVLVRNVGKKLHSKVHSIVDPTYKIKQAIKCLELQKELMTVFARNSFQEIRDLFERRGDEFVVKMESLKDEDHDDRSIMENAMVATEKVLSVEIIEYLIKYYIQASNQTSDLNFLHIILRNCSSSERLREIAKQIVERDPRQLQPLCSFGDCGRVNAVELAVRVSFDENLIKYLIQKYQQAFVLEKDEIKKILKHVDSLSTHRAYDALSNNLRNYIESLLNARALIAFPLFSLDYVI
ncbi:hypothetical protein [Parachlamydia acanthamoebae]|uniref:hypothetical protein n=1 Tax=Parachlamydia acanthamoebae TaxID=83552 RepID=UPI0007517523|nr:hypothetical protein [Parachlamydia acanthamoebae]